MNKHAFPEEYMSAGVSRHYLNVAREIEDWLSKRYKPGRRQAPFKSTTFELTMEQLIMARKRGVNTRGNTGKPTGGTSGNSRPGTRWINVSLSDDDTAFLAESTAGLAELAAMACECVSSGFSLTVKPMDGGDSVMACIVSQPDPNQGGTCGVSGFATNVRDALLVVLYKFEDRLGGQFPDADSLPAVERPRFR